MPADRLRRLVAETVNECGGQFWVVGLAMVHSDHAESWSVAVAVLSNHGWSCGLEKRTSRNNTVLTYLSWLCETEDMLQYDHSEPAQILKKTTSLQILSQRDAVLCG